MISATPESVTARKYRLGIVFAQPIHYFIPLFRTLARQPGLDFEVLYCWEGASSGTFCPEFGIKVKIDTPLLDGYRHRFLWNLSPFTRTRFFGLVNPGLWREVSAGRYDAVMLLGWGHFSMWLAAAAARARGIPVFLYGDSVPSSPERWPKRLWKTALLRALFKRVDAFLVSGAFNRAFYLSHGADERRMFKAPWSIDNDYFIRESDRHRPDRARSRRAVGAADDQMVCLFVGKLISRKRPMDLLRAVEELSRQGRDIFLLYVGDGPERKRLEAYVSRRGLSCVRFHGFANQSELPKLYAAGDVFVLPSEEDPRGTVTNEAMACGLPVVVSDKVGVWGEGDIVKPGENGLVYPAGDVNALAAALDRLLDGPRRSEMGRRSREIIKTWNFDIFAEGVLEALDFVSTGR